MQNNTIRTNYVKAKIDNIQKSSKYRLCRERDEMVNPIVSGHSKLAQMENKTRHDWLGKVIQLDLFKKIEFDHTIKWYIHKSESILENAIQRILYNFEIQMDHLISARRLDLMLINKKKYYHLIDVAVLEDHRMKIKIKQNERKILRPCQRTKKLWNIRVTVILIVVGALGMVSKGLKKSLEE